MEVNLSETWIVIKVDKSNYCINSEYVKGISELSTAIYKKPANLSRFIRGNYCIYGAIVPVIDLRRVLGYSSIEDEKMKFSGYVHKVIYEHETWIDELEWTVFTKDKFTKNIDCSDSNVLRFIEGLDGYSHRISIEANKIKEPLCVIYELAKEIVESKNNKDIKNYQDKLKEIKRQSNRYIVKNLENIIYLNNKIYEEVCLVIRCKGTTFGIVVDSIEMISDKSTNIARVYKDKASAGTIQLKNKDYNILNLTKLTNIIKSEGEK